MGMNIFRCEARSLRSVGPCENKAAVCAGELHRPATLTHVLLIKRGTTVFNWWSASHMAIPWTTRSSTAHQLMQEQISGLQWSLRCLCKWCQSLSHSVSLNQSWKMYYNILYILYQLHAFRENHGLPGEGSKVKDRGFSDPIDTF